MIGGLLLRLLGRASAQLARERNLVRIGGLSLALALGVAFLPGLFPESIFRPLSGVFAGPVVIGLFGLVAGALAVLALRQEVTGGGAESSGSKSGGSESGDSSRNTSDSEDLWVPRRTPERAHFDEHRTTGDDIDSVFDDDAEDGRDLGTRRTAARGRIRETAIAVIAAAENCNHADAARRIDDGSWTGDPRAAAFLGGARHAPLRIRIRDWASGEGYERWATHAVAEIEALAAGEGRR